MTRPINRNVITKFDREYRFLSNFYFAPVILDLEMYPSVEHAYQAAKTTDALKRYLIAQAESAEVAKRMGNRLKNIRPRWDAMKIDVMRDLLKQKFAPGRDLTTRLMNTEKIPLIEGNLHGDTFWGVCGGVGENHLGKLLMEIREHLHATEYA